MLKQDEAWALETFFQLNQTLIAQHGQRIMQNPENLMAQILKDKYFKHSSFIEAKLASNLSLVWTSILQGRQVLHKGSRQKIRNGEHVYIYKSNWIPKLETLNHFSPQILPPYSIAAGLISNQQWKEDVITQHYMEDIAARIL